MLVFWPSAVSCARVLPTDPRRRSHFHQNQRCNSRHNKYFALLWKYLNSTAFLPISPMRDAILVQRFCIPQGRHVFLHYTHKAQVLVHVEELLWTEQTLWLSGGLHVYMCGLYLMGHRTVQRLRVVWARGLLYSGSAATPCGQNEQLKKNKWRYNECSLF